LCDIEEGKDIQKRKKKYTETPVPLVSFGEFGRV
jgi:hypothetical protein